MQPADHGLDTSDVAEKCMEHGWNYIDREQPKYSHKKQTCPNFAYHKSRVHRPEIEPEFPLLNAETNNTLYVTGVSTSQL